MSNSIDEKKAKDKIRHKKYNAEHREEINEKQKQYRSNNKEIIAEKKKQYQAEHREEHNERQKRYREKKKQEKLAKEHEEIINEFLANIVN
jgi:hypothetical protein